VVAASLLLAAPALVFAYLPMTDMPQRFAIVRILSALDDPRFGFAPCYESAWTRTLYLLPYALAFLLAKLVPFETAMRSAIFVPLFVQPLAVLAWLRSLGKPPLFALLALPFVYNRAFFWGALPFEYAFAFALLACGLIAKRTPRPGSKLAAALACAAVVLSNPYGVMLVLCFVALCRLFGDRGVLARSLPALAVLAAGCAGWLLVGGQAAPTQDFYFEPLARRLADFEDEILGGYRGPWEDGLLAAFAALWLWLSRASLPATRARWRALAPAERAVYALALACACLYFVLPTHTAYAKAVHFRFALISAALLPLVTGTRALATRPRLAQGLVAALALATLALAWTGLARFDREARSFDAVLAHLPEQPRAVALTYERNGRVLRSAPYLHFLAYVQAQRGGLIAASFVGEFWQEPVRERRGSGRPASPPDLAWFPERFDADGFGAFYDWVIVRMRRGRDESRLAPDRYELVLDQPPWRLYHARAR
jgi:hypothetical protein